MVDRSPRPHHQPNRTPQHLVRKIVLLRWKQRLGPVQIGDKTGCRGHSGPGCSRVSAGEGVGPPQPLAENHTVVVDLDATLIGAHSEKELASPNYKRGFGFHPMMAFVDHGLGGTSEPLAAMLRTGKATANSAEDQIAVLDAALAQLPEQSRSKVLVRGDSGAGVREFVQHVHNLGLQYSVGIYGRQPILDALAALPRQAWKKALDTDGRRREGALVAELTRWLPATFAGWPPGMRVIARKERPHPGAQLRITDENGWRITMFATNTTGPTLLSSRSGTAPEPAAKTGSATSKTPAPRICPCTRSPRTRSGSSSPNSPPS